MASFAGMAAVAGGALIASPSSLFREQVMQRLNGRCRPVQQALGGADALAQLETGEWQVLFLDRRVSDLDTEELTAIIQRRFPGTKVVLLDSDAGVAGGREIHARNPPPSETRALAWASSPETRGLDTRRIESRTGESGTNEPRVKESRTSEPLPGMIGCSPAMQQVYRLARLVAPRLTTVLIAGATGSGKELVARALHHLSPRSAKAFVAVNCAAIPETLLESELFGHARGAFTGAVQAQAGRIAAAHGGTLFLDEVSELPLGMQAKLLRFLEEKEVQRLGASEATRVDVRVVAASNVDLAAWAARGEFREDLFYRLSAFPLFLPTLAERREDIVDLAEHFLGCMAAALGEGPPGLSPEAARVLEAHAWKGNVRELQHVMERASILLEGGDTIRAEHLYFSYQVPAAQPGARHHSCSSLAS
jgi:DNA-binding NtrC family response regulator